MSIGPPIADIRLFQTSTLKFQRQWHVCGKKLRSRSQPRIQSVCFFFVSHQFVYPYSKIWPWISKFKVVADVRGRGHIDAPAPYHYTCFSFHVNHAVFTFFVDTAWIWPKVINMADEAIFNAHMLLWNMFNCENYWNLRDSGYETAVAVPD